MDPAKELKDQIDAAFEVLVQSVSKTLAHVEAVDVYELDLERARAMAYAQDKAVNELVPLFATFRRNSMINARQRMSAQALADALGISRARVYAILDEKNSDLS